jgi:hypothetical protein
MGAQLKLWSRTLDFSRAKAREGVAITMSGDSTNEFLFVVNRLSSTKRQFLLLHCSCGIGGYVCNRDILPTVDEEALKMLRDLLR